MRKGYLAFPAAVAALAISLAVPLLAHAEPAEVACDLPFNMLRLAHPLSRLAHRLATSKPITIVAIGSSSTAGAGASTASATYPSRLAVELERHFPNRQITVINRGVNGEEVNDMVKRFDSAVVDAKPDLVLWQFGTNSIVRDQNLNSGDTAIQDGLKKIRAIGADVVIIDPQFAPKVIANSRAAATVELIATTAKYENVDLFHRYDVMKREVDHIPFKIFVSQDGLHMNDWSYACMAKGLGMAIAEAAQRPVMAATMMSHGVR